MAGVCAHSCPKEKADTNRLAKSGQKRWRLTSVSSAFCELIKHESHYNFHDIINFAIASTDNNNDINTIYRKYQKIILYFNYIIYADGNATNTSASSIILKTGCFPDIRMVSEMIIGTPSPRRSIINVRPYSASS